MSDQLKVIEVDFDDEPKLVLASITDSDTNEKIQVGITGFGPSFSVEFEKDGNIYTYNFMALAGKLSVISGKTANGVFDTQTMEHKFIW